MRDTDRIRVEAHRLAGSLGPDAATVFVMERHIHTRNPPADLQLSFERGRAPREALEELAPQLGERAVEDAGGPAWPGRFGNSLGVTAAAEAARRLGLAGVKLRVGDDKLHAFALDLHARCGWGAFERAIALVKSKLGRYDALPEAERWAALQAALGVATDGAAMEVIAQHRASAAYPLDEKRIEEYTRRLKQ
jgi:hypothetical protein